MTDEEVIAALTQVKGIGRWTAEMFLIFRLQRPDVLPVGDLGIVNAIQKAYRLRKKPTPDRMRKLGEAWRPVSIRCLAGTCGAASTMKPSRSHAASRIRRCTLAVCALAESVSVRSRAAEAGRRSGTSPPTLDRRPSCRSTRPKARG